MRGLLIVALAAGCATAQAPSAARDLLAVRGFDTRDTVLTCYSGAGFDRELQAGRRHDIRLVGLDQLYANQGLSVR